MRSSTAASICGTSSPSARPARWASGGHGGVQIAVLAFQLARDEGAQPIAQQFQRLADAFVVGDRHQLPLAWTKWTKRPCAFGSTYPSPYVLASLGQRPLTQYHRQIGGGIARLPRLARLISSTSTTNVSAGPNAASALRTAGHCLAAESAKSIHDRPLLNRSRSQVFSVTPYVTPSPPGRSHDRQPGECSERACPARQVECF